jgi:enamine deaminase RidA (YjgF/YER057c/UK114 family)
MRELKISKNSFGTLHGSTQSRRPVATIGMSRFAADIASRAGSVLLQACFEGKSKHYSQSRVMPPASKHCGKAEMKMKRLVNILFCVLLGLVVTSSSLFAQTATGAEARLKEMNIILPPVPAPVANYVDSVRVGNLLFLAGNTAGADWKFKGKVGKDITVQEGYETARQVGLIMLAKVRAALGSLDRVKRIVKVLGMVNSPEGFGDQPRVVNGFSDLMVEVFGTEMGKHARSAVGMQALPSNSAVEVEMIVEIEK